jgi:membrane protein CcdC involved in cytochrome C biogenesis
MGQMVSPQTLLHEFSPKTLSLVVAVVGFCGMIAWRIREGRQAVTFRNIIAPPLGMSTGLCMFIVPAFRVPWTWALIAFAVGALLLAYPLLRTSRLTLDGDTVMVQRSASFFLVLVVLAVIRFLAKGYFGQIMTMKQTAGLFFLLAFGMIVRWRVSMLAEYKRITSRPVVTATL